MTESDVASVFAEPTDGQPDPGHEGRKSFVRYGIVGVSGYALGVSVFAGLVALGFSPYVCLPVSFACNTTWNFVLNRAWSFPSTGKPLVDDLARFLVVALATLGVNYALLFVLHDIVDLEATPSQALAILAIVPLGYLGQRFWAFSTS